MEDPRSSLELGPEICRDPVRSIEREWLVTNGIGGYAFGTVSGVATRSYHGLLVAALTPPVGRTVLVGGLEETVTVGDLRVVLPAVERENQIGQGAGERHLTSVRLEGMRPVFEYRVDDTILEKRVWMAHGANTTYVRYSIGPGAAPVRLELTPLTTDRDHHSMARELDGIPAGPLRIFAPGGESTPAGRWVRGVVYREETARGQADVSDLYAAVTIRATVTPDRPFTLILTAEADDPVPAEEALAAVRRREARLLRTADAGTASSFVRQLVLAADQFIVARDIPTDDGIEHGRSVIAGYPWFNDWGRDTMIALPGLCLATGRYEEAATILRSFARFVRDGLLPNDFPDRAEDIPQYHTIDASLWYPIAIRAYTEAAGDPALLDELLPTLQAILDAHVAGTCFGIGMDPGDGLLRGGAEGYQLTWMDARVDDWVVTPRRGKPVEIQALWVNALRIVGGRLRELGDPDGAGSRYLATATLSETSFRARFWDPSLGHLLDLVDGPDGDDRSLRPNQLFALSLPYPLIDGDQARGVLAAVHDALAVPFGLRSLARSDPAYRPHYQGDRRFRDAGYHQGTVWTWLVGAYAEATARVTGDTAAGLDVLRPFASHLLDGGLGSVSEILEPEPPFEPRGCPFQAWGVAEVLRVWRALGGE
jgi:predicted glycogen debranching enzyme